MSTAKNAAGAIVPVRESRRKDTGSAPLAALNAELVLDLDGDANVTIHINSNGVTLNATYVIEGSVDGTNYDPLLVYAYIPGCVGGTLPAPAQPIISEAVNAVVRRTLCVAVGGLRKIRARLSGWTAGSTIVTMNADTADSIHPYVENMRAGTLHITNTAAAGVAVTTTLPAAVGLRHYVEEVVIVRTATVVQTASATPYTTTSANLPGTPAFTMGVDAAAIGQDKEIRRNFGGAGLAALLANTATSFTAPASPGNIMRVDVTYRLGF